MKYERLTTKNQWGNVLYIGPEKQGTYRGIGDYAEDLPPLIIDKILNRLYLYEENIESLIEDVSNDER